MTQLVRFFSCVLVAAIFLYAYIHKHNQLTALQMKVPLLQKKLKTVSDEVALLQFEKEKFENPLHLMELAGQPQFGYLKHPFATDIVEVSFGDNALHE